MVGAGDGAGDDGEGCHRVHGNHGGRGEEVAGKDGRHACILHTDLDGEGAPLGCVEAESLSHEIAEQVARAVVERHDGKRQQDKMEAVCL